MNIEDVAKHLSTIVNLNKLTVEEEHKMLYHLVGALVGWLEDEEGSIADALFIDAVSEAVAKIKEE